MVLYIYGFIMAEKFSPRAFYTERRKSENKFSDMVLWLSMAEHHRFCEQNLPQFPKKGRLSERKPWL